MLKRIQARYTTDTTLEDLNEAAYRPAEDELANPGKSLKQLNKMREKYNFQGEYHCKLCPKKVLNTQQDLNEHLVSKYHNHNLKKYYDQNKEVLEKRVRLLKAMRISAIKGCSAKYKKLILLSFHFKVRNALK